MLNLFKNDLKEFYLEKIKNYFKDEVTKSDIIIGDKYYEWEIKNWSSIKGTEYSSQFTVGGHKWRIKLCTDNEDGKEENKENSYISVCLDSVDAIKESDFIIEHSYVSYVISLRNYCDYACFDAKDSIQTYFNKYSITKDKSKRFKKSNLYKYRKESNRPLVENDRLIIGVYVRLYKYNREQYIEELKEILNDDITEKEDIIGEDYVEWVVNDWSKLLEYSNGPKYSPAFTVGGNKWGFKLFFFNKKRWRLNESNFYAYLTNLDNEKSDNDKENDSNKNICSKFVMSFCNIKDYSNFNAIRSAIYNNNVKKGVNSVYINKFNYKNYIKPLIKDNKLIIGAYIRVYSSNKIDKYVNTLKNLIKDDIKPDDVVGDNFYEWEIKNWYHSMEETGPGPKFSSDFTICDSKWNIKVDSNPNASKKDQKYLKIYLKNLDDRLKKDKNLCIKFVISFRYYNNYNVYKAQVSDTCCFGKLVDGYFRIYINKEKYDYFIKSLIKDDKLVFGVYVLSYRSNSFDQYIDKIKNIINENEKPNNIVVEDQYYEYEIKKWEQIKDYKYSPKFTVGDYKW